MISSFYTAAGGTIWMQKGLDVTANNIANIYTNGYKTDKASFSDLVYTNLRANGISDKVKMGNGVKLQKTDTVFTNGGMNDTGRSLDYALQSDGFFAVQTANGIRYTRNGNFSLSQKSDGKMYLTADDGFVLDPNGQQIVVNNEEEKLNIGVYRFPNQDGLQKEGNNLFTATANSGNAVSVSNADLRQGALENSTVNLADAISDVIMTQRSFQFNAKMVQISDEIMQTVNGLR
jgi:flagellar basal-body rod protein FlgG